MASITVLPVSANDNDAPKIVNHSAQIIRFSQRKALRELPTYLKAGTL